ncbi:MAG: response regulator [Alphaproteobacteria bacterium]|nr:response regulator [Alphaproteobacteria bacterium]
MIGPSILFVDDEQDILDLGVTALENAGLRVLPAISSDVALILLEQGLPFELMITDIVLPGVLDGFALARKARELRHDIKIIYTTGYAGIANVRSRGAPYGEVLGKPWRVRQLVEIVQTVIGGRVPNLTSP